MDLTPFYSQKVRKHGCETPYSFAFIFNSTFSFLSGPFFYILYAPFFLLLGLSIFLNILHTVFWLNLLLPGIFLVFSDPSDIRILSKSGPSNDTKYCLVCKSHIHEKSLHCKYCNKCVYRLDHHCFYVNNCIGNQNYKLYIYCMISMFIYTLFHSCVSLYAFLSYFTNTEFFYKICQAYRLDSLPLLIIIGIFVLLCLLISIYLSSLLYLHWILHVKQMTTLEYSHWYREERMRMIYIKRAEDPTPCLYWGCLRNKRVEDRNDEMV